MSDERYIDPITGNLDLNEFREMMEATVLSGDLVRIDWLLERIARAREMIDENNQVANARIQMQEDFRQGENAKLERFVSWATGEIGTLAPSGREEMRAEYGKYSRNLAHGTFGYRQKPDRIEIDDAVKALNYATENDLFVNVVPEQLSVSKTTLKEHMKETGTIEGDGWHYVDKVDGFYVKTNG